MTSGKKDRADSILKTIGGIALAATASVLAYCVLEISASATKVAEMEGKVEAQKIEAESSVKEFKTRYEAEKPALIQRMDSFESRFEKFETKIDGRFDRIEGKMDSLIKK